MSPPSTQKAFFKEALIYQIYPASFCDSNADGFGDLPGIRSKLGYLQSLGVDVLWLSPIYKSPLKDMGYDISDYRAIDERYGTLEDWEAFVKDLHARGMKLMMDLVVNHTSDQHEWFLSSRSSKTDPKRDWYIWRPAKYTPDGTRQPPNNWASVFGGSAWEWDATTEEYYLHLYVTEQPDLNWENPAVREAVWEMMLWWLSKGSDGFRMDVINLISKAPGLPDAEVVDPSTPWQPGYDYYVNGPKVHDYLQEMNRRVLSQYPNALTVGETPFKYDPAEVIKYVHPDRKELQMVFLFEIAGLDSDVSSPLIPVKFTLPALKRVINKWQTFMYERGGWNSVFLENHDLARSVSRFLGFSSEPEAGAGELAHVSKTSDTLRARAAKLLALLQTTQGGTLYVYQGEELGMANVPKSWPIEEYKDVATLNFYNEVLERRSKTTPNPDMRDVLDGINQKARDNARTPMQWDESPHAGFTSPSAEPWMRANSDYKNWNAADQTKDPASVYTFWKDAIALRKKDPVLTYGDFVLLSEDHEQIFAYTRTLQDTKALVVLNFSEQKVEYAVSVPGDHRRVSFILGNVGTVDAGGGFLLSAVRLTLEPYEGRIYLTDGA